MKFFERSVLCALATMLAGALGLTGCGTYADSQFYRPNHKVYGTPDQVGLAYERVNFTSADGTALTGWFLPAKGPAHGTVVHFHGNGMNMTAYCQILEWIPEGGFNLFVFDYRGYGASAGWPTREGVYEDAVAAMRYIKARPDIDQSKIILFGNSLGGTMALRVAGENHFDGLVGVVDDSGYASYPEVAADHIGWLAYLVVPPGGSAAAAAAQISPVPLLIIHGTKDSIVPFKHAEQIYTAAKEPKELWSLDADHAAAFLQYRSEYAPRLLTKLLEWTEAKPPTGVNSPPK